MGISNKTKMRENPYLKAGDVGSTEKAVNIIWSAVCDLA